MFQNAGILASHSIRIIRDDPIDTPPHEFTRFTGVIQGPAERLNFHFFQPGDLAFGNCRIEHTQCIGFKTQLIEETLNTFYWLIGQIDHLLTRRAFVYFFKNISVKTHNYQID